MVRMIIPGTAHWRIAAAAITLAVCFGAPRQARAGEPDVAGTVEELKALLEQYDRAGGNTIPIEQALIRLKEARAGKELVPFLARLRHFARIASACNQTR
jgi:hypothetical protein